MLLGDSDSSLEGMAVADAKDNLGETPYDWAVGAAQVEAAEMLRSTAEIGAATTIRRPEMGSAASGSSGQQQQQEGSVSPRLGPISPDQPVGYFPEFYGKRSGLDSSIIGVNIGQREA